MSEQVTTTETVATDSPTETERSTEQPAVTSDSGQSSNDNDQQAVINKAIGDALARERKKYSADRERLAEFDKRDQEAKLQGMTQTELSERLASTEAELQTYRERDIQSAQAKAEALTNDKAKAYVASLIEKGDIATAETFMEALSSETPQPQAPTSSQHSSVPQQANQLTKAKIHAARAKGVDALRKLRDSVSPEEWYAAQQR